MYTIYCTHDKCQTERELVADIEYGVGGESIIGFWCPVCNTDYDWESGVIDMEMARDMFKLYLGAKTAGLLPDPLRANFADEAWKDATY